MKTSKKTRVTFVLLTTIALSFATFSVTYATASKTREIASAFVENALPVDLTKYTVKLTKYTDMNSTADIVQYTLESEESVLVVNCYVQEETLIGCNLESKRGIVITDQPYASLADSIVGFLEKYQTYTERDSTEMINMLSNVDATKNSTVTTGNLKLTVLKQEAFGADITGLSWTYTINGVDYTSLKIGFRNGAFDALHDNRGVYTIGDTEVKVTKEQAINAAIEYVRTYSYAMPDGSRISGFGVVNERTVAELYSAVKDTSVLYPFWQVRLPLDKTFPGSVDTFIISIWAGSGDVFNVGHQGSGGGLPIAGNADGNASDLTTTMYLAGATVAIIIAVVAFATFTKKRKSK